jgi:hypothetical protein
MAPKVSRFFQIHLLPLDRSTSIDFDQIQLRDVAIID